MRNETVTLDSLMACVALLYVDNKDDFCKAYELATHSKGITGGRTWELITREKANKYYHAHKKEIRK